MTMTTTVKASKKGYITIILTALCFVVLMLSLPCRAFAFTGYYVNANGEIVDTYRDGRFFVEETTHRACMENGRLAAAESHWASMDDSSTCTICHAKDIVAQNLFDDIFHYYSYEGMKETACFTGCHYALCTEADTCIQCKQQGVTMESVLHNVEQENNGYDYDHHWTYCINCGETIYEGEHYAYCTNPDICFGCGHGNVDIKSINHCLDYSSLRFDETGHWFECSDCIEKVGFQSHTATCDNRYACLACDYYGVIINISHNFDFTDYQHDDYSHWFICISCDERQAIQSHQADHSQPTECTICHTTGLDPNAFVHHYVDCYDKFSHWSECTVCGCIIDRQPHYQYCDDADTDTCTLCGHTGIDIAKVYHQNEIMIADKTGHYYTCTTCSTTSWGGCHFDLDNCSGSKCSQCGMTSAETEIFGDHDLILLDKYDPSGHWYQCTMCGVQQQVKHIAQCTEPSLCIVCGMSGEGITFDIKHSRFAYTNKDGQLLCHACNTAHVHDFFCDFGGYCGICGIHISQVEGAVQTHSSGVYHSDNTHHWYACHVCARIVNREVHHYVDGICPTCGKTTDSLPVYSAGQTLMLPAELTTIADEAFTDNAAHCIIIPAGCVSIGASAFANCSQLESVTLPASVSFIADDAFTGIDRLLISAPAGSYAASWTINHGYTLIEH